MKSTVKMGVLTLWGNNNSNNNFILRESTFVVRGQSSLW